MPPKKRQKSETPSERSNETANARTNLDDVFDATPDYSGDAEPDFRLDMKEVFDFLNEKKLLDDSVSDLKKRIKNGEQNLEQKLASVLLRRAAHCLDDEDKKATGDFKAAIKLLNAVLKKNPNDFAAARTLGVVYLTFGTHFNDRGDWDDAISQYNKAAKQFDACADQGDAESKMDKIGVQLNLASVYLEMDRFDDSLKLCDRSIEQFREFSQKESRFKDDSLYYLSRALTLKANVLGSQDEVDSESSRNAAEIRALNEETVDILRRLVAAGRDEYKMEFVESLYELIDGGAACGCGCGSGDCSHSHSCDCGSDGDGDCGCGSDCRCGSGGDCGSECHCGSENGDSLALIDEGIRTLESVSSAEEGKTHWLCCYYQMKGIALARSKKIAESLNVFDELLEFLKRPNDLPQSLQLEFFAKTFEFRAKVEPKIEQKIADWTSAIQCRREKCESAWSNLPRLLDAANGGESSDDEFDDDEFGEDELFDQISSVLDSVAQILSCYYERASLYNESKEPQKAAQDCDQAIEFVESLSDPQTVVYFEPVLNELRRLKSAVLTATRQ